MIIKISHITTLINSIFKPHSSYDKLNVLKSIIQQTCLSNHLKFIGFYLLKPYNFIMNYFDYMEKLYGEYELAYYQQQYKYVVYLGTVSTTNTNISTESKSSFEQLHNKNK